MLAYTYKFKVEVTRPHQLPQVIDVTAKTDKPSVTDAQRHASKMVAVIYPDAREATFQGVEACHS